MIFGVVQNLGPGVGTFFLFLGLGFPDSPLKTKQGTLFIPRLLPGLQTEGLQVAGLELKGVFLGTKNRGIGGVGFNPKP